MISKKAKLLNSRVTPAVKPGAALPGDLPDPKDRKGKDAVVVLRIDPFEKKIARMTMMMTTEPKSAAAEVSRVCRTNRVGSQDLDLMVAGCPLYAAGGVDVDPSNPGWIIKGQLLEDDTTGIGLLFAKGPNGGMISLPPQISMGWARDHVIWTEGKPDDDDGD